VLGPRSRLAADLAGYSHDVLARRAIRFRPRPAAMLEAYGSVNRHLTDRLLAALDAADADADADADAEDGDSRAAVRLSNGPNYAGTGVGATVNGNNRVGGRLRRHSRARAAGDRRRTG
jgi:hypothetical protein